METCNELFSDGAYGAQRCTRVAGHDGQHAIRRASDRLTSEIRAYLEQKAALPEKEWLRREPHTTSPAILAAVRAAGAAGMTYDDDVERYVEHVAGDMPEHRHHGHDDRHRLTYQLGHEVYLAKCILRDERDAASAAAARADGFAPLDSATVEDGAWYLVRLGTCYVGQEQPTYSEPRKLRARRDGERIIWMPPRARTRGLLIGGPVLVKVA